MINTYSPHLVVLDGVTKAYELHDLEPNDAKQTAEFFRRILDPWAHSGAAVLTIDHVVKMRDQRAGWAAGSGLKKALIALVMAGAVLPDDRTTWSSDLLAEWEERAALMEFEGRLPRDLAEQQAEQLVRLGHVRQFIAHNALAIGQRRRVH